MPVLNLLKLKCRRLQPNRKLKSASPVLLGKGERGTVDNSFQGYALLGQGWAWAWALDNVTAYKIAGALVTYY